MRKLWRIFEVKPQTPIIVAIEHQNRGSTFVYAYLAGAEMEHEIETGSQIM